MNIYLLNACDRNPLEYMRDDSERIQDIGYTNISRLVIERSETPVKLHGHVWTSILKH